MGDDQHQGERLPWIQTFRALAALLVLFQHVTQLPHPSITAASRAIRLGMGPLGSAGVDLFFVISGFVIAHSIAAKERIVARHFLAARAVRIIPLFWIVSAAYILELWLFGDRIAPAALWSTVTLIPAPGHNGYVYPVLYVGWSLGFELVFYALASTFLTRARSNRATLLLGLLIGLSLAGVAAGKAIGSLGFVVNGIMAEFALGVAVWLIWRNGVDARLAMPLAGAGLVLFASSLFVNVGQGFDTDPVGIITNVTGIGRALIWGLPIALMLLGTAIGFRDRPTTAFDRLGDASFSLYLVHPIILYAVEQSCALYGVGNDYAFMALVMCLCVGAAIPMHRWLEKPIMRWSRRASRSPGSTARLDRSPIIAAPVS